MKSIGIDIGTTTISFVITDNDTLTVLQKYTIAGNSFYPDRKFLGKDSGHRCDLIPDPSRAL